MNAVLQSPKNGQEATLEVLGLSKDGEDKEAFTELWTDWEWDSRAEQLPPGVINRLKVADRSLRSARAILEMVFAARRGMDDSRDSGARYSGLK